MYKDLLNEDKDPIDEFFLKGPIDELDTPKRIGKTSETSGTQHGLMSAPAVTFHPSQFAEVVVPKILPRCCGYFRS